jgi:hypothetical protein
MGSRQMKPPGTHVVEQGEDAVSIAWAYGFSDWEDVWNHEQNRAVRESHRSPKVLSPGTELFVPENPKARFDLRTNQPHRIQIEVPTTNLDVRIALVDGRPLANREYALFYRHGGRDEVIEGSTDGDGWVRHEKLPIDVPWVWVVFRDSLQRYRLELRGLDPVRVGSEPYITGVQARLNNLGFFAGNIDGKLGPKTRSALRQFQLEVLEEEEPTGEIDDATLDALEKEHGS